MFAGKKVGLVIPALNEEQTIGAVVAAVDRALVDLIVVVDNGSSDETPQRARAAGAQVVSEARRGYGSACLKGIATASDCDVLVFMDGDGSDDAAQIPEMLALLDSSGLDLVLASRTIGHAEPGALSPLQVFGSWLTSSLVLLFWGVRYTDLGPLRAIRMDALDSLQMSDPDFGWTVEMQVKAAQRRLAVAEIAANYRNRRAGDSKVSGTIRGSYLAGRRILGYVLSAKLRELTGRSVTG